MRRPLFAAGLTALITLFFCMSLEPAALVFVTGAVFLLAGAALLTRRREAARLALTAAAVYAVFSLLFAAHLQLRVLPSEALYGATASVEGTLKDDPAPTENSVCYTLRNCEINGAPTRLNVRVYASGETEAAPGDVLRFSAVRFFRNEAQDSFYYHTLSGGAWLSGYGYAPKLTARYEGFSLLYRIAALRRAAQARLSRSLEPLHARIAAALFTGEGGSLPADFRARLRVAGASHLFAVSGMHLSLWTGALFLLLQKRAKTKAWANGAASLFVVFYIFFTGCSPSVVRAGIMLLAAFLGRSIRRHADPLNTLGLAALVQLLPNPFLAGNVSFLLSFSATAAIFILFPYFTVTVRGRPGPETRLLRRAAAVPNVLALSLCVLFFTVPVSSSFFTGVSLLSPLSSLLCALPAEGVMLTSALGLASAFLPPVSAFFFRLCGGCCTVIAELLQTLSGWDFALCPVRAPDVALWYAGTLCVFVAVWFFSRKNSRIAVCSLLVSASLVLLTGGGNALLSRDRVDLLIPPAGNATSVAVVFGRGTAAQIGAGGTYDGAAATAAFLGSNGVTSVKTLIVPDEADAEAGQLEYFANNFAPVNVFSAEGTRKFFPTLRNELWASSFSVTFRAGAVYENLRGPAFTAGLLTVGERTAVLCFSPSADLSAAPARFRQGDLLICRAGIPAGVDPAAFGGVIVMTDKSAAALRLPENAVATADTGGIAIRIR